MTNIYITGNPIGSKSPQDLSDNASNFDEWVNTTSPAAVDRFGKQRLTWAGAEYEWQQMLQNSGYEPVHLVYVDGSPLTVARPTQLIDRAGFSYRIKLPVTGGFPVTLTGTWAADVTSLAEVVDAAFPQQLADRTSPLNGSALVGRAALRFNSVAEARATPGRFAGDIAWIDSYLAGDKKGQGFADWVGSAATDDGGMILAASGGHWKRRLTARGNVDAGFYGLPLASGFCTAQDLAIEAYCFANKVSAWYGPGVYDFGNDNWAWSGPRVAGQPMKDYAGVTIYSCREATFQTTSANGADVMQCCGIRNFSVLGYPGVTGTLTAGSPTHGTNGLSLVYGAENCVFELNCVNLPGLFKSDGSIGGGQAFTLQPGSGNTNAYKNIVLRGNAINCSVGFGLDVGLSEIVAAPMSAISVDVYAELCYRGFVIGGAAYTAAPSLNAAMGVVANMRLVNCQQSVVMVRAKGVEIDAQVINSLPKASLIKHAFNNAVMTTYLAGVQSCGIKVAGRVLSCDKMLSLGGTSMGGGVATTTNQITLEHRVTSSGSTVEVEVVDFSGSVSDSIISLYHVTSGYDDLVTAGNALFLNGKQLDVVLFPGDASVTLPNTAHATAVYDTPITAIRTVSFPAGAVKGMRKTIQRLAGASGASGLSINGQFNLAAGAKAEMVYNGASWVQVL